MHGSLTQMQMSLKPSSHCFFLSPESARTVAAQLLSVPSSELYSGVGSSPFSTSKPPTIVCRARNESTQRSIKPGSSQPTVPLTPNCPLSLVRVCVCERTHVYVGVDLMGQNASTGSQRRRPQGWQLWAWRDVMSTCQTVQPESRGCAPALKAH